MWLSTNSSWTNMTQQIWATTTGMKRLWTCFFFFLLLLYVQVVLSQHDTRRNTWPSFPCRQPLSETGYHLVWLHLCSGNVHTTHTCQQVLCIGIILSVRRLLNCLSAAYWGCVLSKPHSPDKPDAELSCHCKKTGKLPTLFVWLQDVWQLITSYYKIIFCSLLTLWCLFLFVQKMEDGTLKQWLLGSRVSSHPETGFQFSSKTEDWLLSPKENKVMHEWFTSDDWLLLTYPKIKTCLSEYFTNSVKLWDIDLFAYFNSKFHISIVYSNPLLGFMKHDNWKLFWRSL